MPSRFRKTFTLFPGVKINIAKGSVSASLGIDGATVNIGKNGVQSTFGLPGTGLSHTTHHSSSED